MDSQGGGVDRLPVVLIHGAGGSHLDWPAGIRRIKGFRVISLDLPGHGRSDGSACGSVVEYADALNSYFRSASIFRALVIGYCLGGQIAVQFAMDHPEQCGGLGLIASGIHFHLPDDLYEMIPNPATYPQALKTLQSLWLNNTQPGSQFDLLSKRVFTVRQGTLAADFQAIKNWSYPHSETWAIQVPVWICAAKEDRLIPLSSARALSKKIQGACFSVIPNAGHGVLFESPGQVQSELYRFLGIEEDIRG